MNREPGYNDIHIQGHVNSKTYRYGKFIQSDKDDMDTGKEMQGLMYMGTHGDRYTCIHGSRQWEPWVL